MTTERIADMQARIHSLPIHHHLDSIDFQLVRARLRVLQEPGTQGMHEAAEFFNDQIEQNPRTQTAASKYGLAFIAFKQSEYDKARKLLAEARVEAKQEQKHIPVQATDAQTTPVQPSYEAILDNLDIDIALSSGNAAEAVKLADAARDNFPISRGIAHQYAEALMAASRNDDAVAYLRDQAQLYRQEPQIQDLLAKAYATQGKQALQHMALAESYALNGNLMGGLEQLALARKAPDASFYESAVIDARERAFKEQWKEEHEDDKKKK
jgi:predicted Zn-dependent protease